MTDGALRPVVKTTFQSEGILEREHLQAALRDDISLLGDDLLVVAEEFSGFDGANRRIDLLCIDLTGKLVVVELKRTTDGGHMELQSLRYAAMVSTMSRDDLEEIYRIHLNKMGDTSTDPEQHLADWLVDADDTDTAVPSRDVRIILASAGFDRQITSAVLWLTELHGLDIQCVRLTPYRVDDRLLLDVQQVIPLPEAAELTVQIRRKEQAARARTLGRDRTKYSVTTPSGTSDPLAKRRAILCLVEALHDAGVTGEHISGVLPNAKFLFVDGDHSDEDLTDAFVTKYERAEKNLRRWFFKTPLHDNGRTWVLSNQWGTQTEQTLTDLLALAPTDGFGFDAH